MLSLLTLLPAQAAVLLLSLAGLALIARARRAAAALAIAACALLILPALSAPFLGLLPPWVRWFIALGTAFGVMRALLRMTIGGPATEHAIGILAADLIRFTILLPFRVVAALWGGAFHRRD